jgi:DNA-binding NarL/FixJ family response regulator
VNVTIVEDDTRYRESLTALIAHASGFTMLESFGSAADAVKRMREASDAGTPPAWDIVLMDVGLPGMSGIEATRVIKRVIPKALVVVLTVFEEPPTILEAICAGADGYLLKKTPPQELLTQLQVVAAGGAPLTAGVARTLLDLVRSPSAQDTDAAPDDGLLRLTERERDVLRGLVRGLAYKQVADTLGISIDTVRTHIRAIYRKLQVHSVAEAVGRAIRGRLA